MQFHNAGIAPVHSIIITILAQDIIVAVFASLMHMLMHLPSSLRSHLTMYGLALEESLSVLVQRPFINAIRTSLSVKGILLILPAYEWQIYTNLYKSDIFWRISNMCFSPLFSYSKTRLGRLEFTVCQEQFGYFWERAINCARSTSGAWSVSALLSVTCTALPLVRNIVNEMIMLL